jgi:hypothetical protein
MMREGGNPVHSFDGWAEGGALPEYDDHVEGHKLSRPSDDMIMEKQERPLPSRYPNNPHSGSLSAVPVVPHPRFGGNNLSGMLQRMARISFCR